MTETIKKYFSLELTFWSASLVYLLIISVDAHSHISFCPLKNAGLTFCPGCGLGASISYLLHLRISDSISAHPLGIPGLIIIVFRIVTLVRNKIEVNKLTKEHL